MNEKRVLIIRNAYSFDFGGGERVPVNIALGLASYNFDVIVVSRSQKLLALAQKKGVQHIKGWWWERQDWSGVKLLFLPLYCLWQMLLFLWYSQLIIRTSTDVVHPQSRDDFIAATLAARLFGKRVIWSDHADLKYVYQNHKIWFKNPIGKIVYVLSKLVYAVILTSENDRQLIEKSLGHKVPENYKVIYNGVSDTVIKPIKREAPVKDKVIFAATSRLVTAKGIGELIEAFILLNEKYPDTRLWLFGEGPEEGRFQSMAKNNKNVTFWGFPPDTLNRLAACDVFVHPSYLEGFSVSLIEAAKLGLPIIACNVGGNPELVIDRKNGLLIPEKNVDALLYAMETLAANPKKRDTYGKAARKTFESKLVFEEIVKNELVPLYE